MIRPEPLFFSRAKHPHSRDHARTGAGRTCFRTILWPEIAEKLAAIVWSLITPALISGCLLACLRAHRQHDSRTFSSPAPAPSHKRTWPHHRRYGLKPLADWLGVRFRHHDALEDSIACAKILLAAGIDREAKSLADLEKRLKLKRGRHGAWGQKGPSGRSRRRSDAKSAAATRPSPGLPFLFPDQVASAKADFQVEPNPQSLDLQRLLIRAEFIRPLSGKQVVFSGRLRTLSRQDAEQLAARLGGTCHESLSETTDLLVVGSPSVDEESQRGEGIGAVKRTR